MLRELPALSVTQYSLIFNMVSLTVGIMVASTAFSMMGRKYLAPKYRPAVAVSSLVTLVAAYHYFRIFQNLDAAYVLNDARTMYQYAGEPLNSAYRYIDWLVTVPLLVVELVLVLGLPKAKTGKLVAKLGSASALMIGLGFIGETAEEAHLFGARGFWGTVSTVPFVYILYVLFVQLSDEIRKQSGRVERLLKNARLLLVGTWGFYPIAYMIPMFFPDYPEQASNAVVIVEMGYSIADITAKAGYGLLIYTIAKAKSEEEGFVIQEMVMPPSGEN